MVHDLVDIFGFNMVEERTFAGRGLHALPHQLVTAKMQDPRRQEPLLQDSRALQQREVLIEFLRATGIGHEPMR